MLSIKSELYCLVFFQLNNSHYFFLLLFLSIDSGSLFLVHIFSY